MQLLTLFVLLLIIISARGHHNVLFRFDKKAVLPLRGILALLIVLHHIAEEIPPIAVFSQLTYWGKYIVSIFFFLSGYGLCVSYANGGVKKSLDGFLKKRIGKLFPPLLIATALNVSLSYLITPSYSIVESFRKTSIPWMPDITNALLPSSWFLVVLITLYASYYIVMRIAKSMKSGITLLLLCSIVLVMVYAFIGLGNWWWLSLFGFNIGTVYACNEQWIRNLIARYSKQTYVCTILSFVLIFGLNMIISNLLIQMISISILPIYIVLIMYRLRISESVILNYMGKISLHIYLAQGAVCALVSQFCFKYYEFMVLVITISIVTARVIYLLSNFKIHNI